MGLRDLLFLVLAQLLRVTILDHFTVLLLPPPAPSPEYLALSAPSVQLLGTSGLI